MKCWCGEETRVLATREGKTGEPRRTRECGSGHRWVTSEVPEEVLKRISAHSNLTLKGSTRFWAAQSRLDAAAQAIESAKARGTPLTQAWTAVAESLGMNRKALKSGLWRREKKAERQHG